MRTYFTALHFFLGLLYKVNILSLMMDMSMLAPTSPQSLYPSSWHANTLRIFPACRHLCWRRPPRKAFILCRGTPTCSGFSGLPASLLAPTSPQSLYPPSWHANMLRIFSACRHLCWRRPPRKVFILCRGTPTCSGFFRPAGAQERKNLHPESNLSLTTRKSMLG